MDQAKVMMPPRIPPPSDLAVDKALLGGRKPLVYRPDRSAAESSRLGFFLLIPPAAVFDLLALPILASNHDPEMRLIAPIVVGILIGQIGAGASWLVWSDGRFSRRLAIHWSVVGALL